MTDSRTQPANALLAGVCSRIADRLGWNVWALRALFVIFLLIKTLWAIAAYAILMVILRFLDNGSGAAKPPPGGLESPELAERSQRISELERKFRELENGDRRPYPQPGRCDIAPSKLKPQRCRQAAVCVRSGACCCS